jgi:hypothetical protein
VWKCSSLLESLQSLIEYETRGVEDDGIHDCGFVCGVALNDIRALLAGSMRECLRDRFYGDSMQGGQAVYESGDVACDQASS